MTPIKTIITTIFLASTIVLFSQNITGNIIDSDTKKPVPFANITHLASNKGVISDQNGHFEIEASIYDTIIVSSMGYHKMQYVIKSYEPLKIVLPPQSYFLGEVKILSEEEVPITYKSVVFPEGDPGIGAAIVSPLSYWYYKLSKEEKSKRQVRNLMDYEKRMAKVMKIYTKELVAEFSGLEGQPLDSCYAFCNANIELVENDDEFTIKFKLLKVLTDFNSSEDMGE